MATGRWMTNSSYSPVFTSQGHLWKGLGTLRGFFTHLRNRGHEVSPLWEVVVLELKETERLPALAMRTPVKRKKT